MLNLTSYPIVEIHKTENGYIAKCSDEDQGIVDGKSIGKKQIIYVSSNIDELLELISDRLKNNL